MAAAAVFSLASAAPAASVTHMGMIREERVYMVSAAAVAVRKKPEEQSARTGEILKKGMVFTVTEALSGDDGRLYLRLPQDRGWLFDDTRIYPDDPAVKLLTAGGISMTSQTGKAQAQRDTPSARILGSIEAHLPGCTTGRIFQTEEHTFYFIQVLRGSKESAVDVAAGEYEALLDRKDDIRLGLKIEVQQTVGCLVVKEVLGGLAAEWNEKHPEAEIRPGDRIVRVNDIEGMPKEAHRLNEECKKREVITLKMRRGTQRPVMPGLRMTVKKAFGHLREGQSGDVIRVDDEGDSLIKFENHGQQWVGRENYDCLAFEDVEGFYLKRYEDFKNLYHCLKRKVSIGKCKCPALASAPLPELPPEETMGFRRFLAQTMSMGSFLEEREAGLQKMMDHLLSRVPTLDSEPLLLEFFGPDPVPKCGGAPLQDVLRLRLDALVERVRKHRAERRQPAGLLN